MKDLITVEDPLKTHSGAVYSYTKNLERKYRFTSSFGDDVLLHKRDIENDEIWLPRGLCPVGPYDMRSDGTHVIFPKTPEPREHQEPMFDKCDQIIKEKRSGIVSAYTGFGKTVLGYRMAYMAQTKTIVVTTKEDIYTQWIDGAEKFLGLPRHRIGEIRQDNCQVLETDFVVAMIHSLSRDKYPAWAFKNFGLVIFDECHRVPADHFSDVVWMLPAKIRIGLSATPDRVDGKMPLFKAHVGPVLAKTDQQLMVPKVLRVRTNWVCPRTYKYNEKTGEKKLVRIPHSADKMTHIYKILAADEDRNHMITDAIIKSFKAGRKIAVFSMFQDHLKTLERLLKKDGVSGKDIGFYIGATTKADKKKREQTKTRPILLTTKQMMSEGTSLDWLDTCILTLGWSNVEQIVGRIRREYEGKKDPLVFDFMDTDSPALAAFCAKRKSFYDRVGATVVEY